MRKNKLLLLLALLLTAATGAWATDDTYTVKFEANGKSKTIENVTLEKTWACNYNSENGELDQIIKELYELKMGYSSNTNPNTSVTGGNGKVTVVSSSDQSITITEPFEGTATVTGQYVNYENYNYHTFTYSLTISIPGYTASSAATGYTVSLKDGVKDADKWTVKVGDGQAQALPIGGLKGDGTETVTLQYNGRLKVKGVKATSEAAPAEEPMTLGTPLTVEAITAGTIQVNTNGTLSTGMKYSVNGGTKTTITSTTTIEGLKAGDKVQFYSNGTSNTAYSNDPEVKISGGTAEVKVYGNIMSLLDEEGFATKTDLLNYAFFGLFMENTTLIDASELLLPAATLAAGCYQQMFQGCTSLTKAPKLPATTLKSYCYYSMFHGCTSLTTAPELPATWLGMGCYAQMFSGCTSLTSAYVKAAYIDETDECYNMFYGCTATGAVLHTTSGNKASWEAKMGTGKEWENWTVADDWEE